MRNRTGFHLPRKEWSKVVRFNSRDYLLRSLYDGEGDIEAADDDAEIYRTHTVFDEVPWYTTIHRRPGRIMEDFFDDLDDIADEIVQNAQDEIEDESNNTYYITLEDGTQKEIQLSADSKKNAVFYILLNFVTLSDGLVARPVLSVDEFLYAYGKRGDLSSYKMNFKGIKYYAGSYRLIVDAEGTSGNLQIYAIDSHNANFKINYPGINNHKPYNIAVFTYQEFCNFLKCDRITLQAKSCDEYYRPIVLDLMEQLKNNNVGLTLCRRKDVVEQKFFGHTVKEAPQKSFIGKFFTPVVKFGKKQGDYNQIASLLSTIDIEDVYNGEGDHKVYNDDEYYVLLGGNDNFIKNFKESLWGSICMSEFEYIKLLFEKPDPELRTNIIRHDMILVPFSRFVLAAPGLITHLF